VSLAAVTEQYLDYIALLEHLVVDQMAEFLVIAARLILIKSQALLPRPPSAEVEEDVGDDLVKQLVAYKQFKEVAKGLSQREEEGLRSFIRVAPPPKIESTHVDLTGITVAHLLKAVRRALDVAEPLPPVGNVVKPFTITIRDQIALIERLLLTQARISFTQLLQRAGSRVELVVTFLATLELLKRRRIEVVQEQMFGEIIILRGAEPAPTPDEGELLSAEDEWGESQTPPETPAEPFTGEDVGGAQDHAAPLP